MADLTPETLTVEQVDALTGDDMAYWLGNPFMTPELHVEKVCWWVTKALAAEQAAREEAEARADKAEAEAQNSSADYDRRGDRLWRLAALAGHTPAESDNDATAELAVTQTLARVAELEAEVTRERARSDAADEAMAVSEARRIEQRTENQRLRDGITALGTEADIRAEIVGTNRASFVLGYRAAQKRIRELLLASQVQDKPEAGEG